MALPFAGQLAALGTAVCWALTPLFFEAAGRRVGSLPVNLLRLVLGLGFLTAYSVAARGHALPTDASLHQWGWLAASGLVGFTFGDLCLFRAFVVVGARLATLIMALAPLFTALFGALFLGERLRPLDAAGMALTVAGIAWVVAERHPSAGERLPRVALSGLLLAVGGALGQALGLVLSKVGVQAYDPFAATQIRVIAGGAGFAVLFTAAGRWPLVAAALRDRPALAHIAGGSFFGPFLGVSLSLLAVQLTAAGVAATLMALSPVVILLPARLAGERVTARAAAGAAVAVAGSALLFA